MYRSANRRPERDNEVTHETSNELVEAPDDVHGADVDCLLLDGAGAHFCTGRDRTADPSDVPWQGANERFVSFDGVARGFGCGIAVRDDLTLAAETATLGFDGIKRDIAPKIVPGYPGTYVDRKIAFDPVPTGRNVGARGIGPMGPPARVLPEDRRSVVADRMSRRRPRAARGTPGGSPGQRPPVGIAARPCGR